MPHSIRTIRFDFIRRAVAATVAAVFACGTVLPPPAVAAAQPATVLDLPVPGTMLPPSDAFTPALIRGIHLYDDNPLKFDFVIHPGDAPSAEESFQQESDKLVTYFLAALTTPEDQLWVNLSPYEADRIIPADFGRTRLGRDMLAQDYLLKQLTASLMYPEEQLGHDFWQRVHARAQQEFGTTEIPLNTFNKVWIVPETATVFAQGRAVYVVETKLKVMLESDYLSLAEHHAESGPSQTEERITSSIVRDVLIPEIEREVNTGRTFANLRQIFSAVVLATWYKQNLRESLLGHVYVDQAKTAGIDNTDTQINQKIYDQYVAAFEKGVYDYIREDYDPVTRQTVPRKYFSGGVQAKVEVRTDASMLSRERLRAALNGSRSVTVELHRPAGAPAADAAILVRGDFEGRLGQSIPMEEWAALELLGRDEIISDSGADTAWRRGTRRLRRELDRRFGVERYDTSRAMDGIFRKLADIRAAHPRTHEDLMRQIIMYGFIYNQERDKFNGLRPVEVLAETLAGIKEDERADRVMVVLNNVIQRGILKERESAADLALKLNNHPGMWPDAPDRVHLRAEVLDRQPYVLVVDDQDREIEGLVSKLRAAGFDVETAKDAQAGLQSIAQRMPDLVITDVTMPGMDGIEFTRRLGRAYPDLPVIVRSGDLGNQDYFPTMLSGFTMNALPNVIGVPGKRTDGLKTTNLVKVYLARVDSAMLIQFARDLNRLGPDVPVAVMPFHMVSAQRREFIAREARQRKVGVYRVVSTDSPYGVQSYVFYNRQALNGLLSRPENTEVLRRAGVPVSPEEFVAFLGEGRDRYVIDREAAALIKQAFGAQLPPTTVNIEIADRRAGPLVRPYVTAGRVAELIDGLLMALEIDEARFEARTAEPALDVRQARDAHTRLQHSREWRARLFTPEGGFDFARNALLINGVPAGAMDQIISPADVIVIAPLTDADAAVYPRPGPQPAAVTDGAESKAADAGEGREVKDPHEALAMVNLVFRSLYVNRKFDARSLVIMYRNAKSVAELFGIENIERLRRARREKAGGYDRGYVLLRERDPQTGEIIEDNGEQGRLLRDNTLKPRIDEGRVSQEQGDWKTVAGDELRAALRLKLNEEFNDIMQMSRRVMRGGTDSIDRLTVVLTNFMEAVKALLALDSAVLADAEPHLEDSDWTFFTLHREGRFDAEALDIMYAVALDVARVMEIEDIEERRVRRLEKSGGYEQGYVLLRERDPHSGEVVEDNGDSGRLLRDGTLQPRIDAGKVRREEGDWKVVQGEELRAALQAKLKEEFDDIVAESRRVVKGEAERSERLAVVVTNFMEAVRALQAKDAALLADAEADVRTIDIGRTMPAVLTGLSQDIPENYAAGADAAMNASPMDERLEKVTRAMRQTSMMLLYFGMANGERLIALAKAVNPGFQHPFDASQIRGLDDDARFERLMRLLNEQVFIPHGLLIDRFNSDGTMGVYAIKTDSWRQEPYLRHLSIWTADVQRSHRSLSDAFAVGWFAFMDATARRTHLSRLYDEFQQVTMLTDPATVAGTFGNLYRSLRLSREEFIELHYHTALTEEKVHAQDAAYTAALHGDYRMITVQAPEITVARTILKSRPDRFRLGVRDSERFRWMAVMEFAAKLRTAVLEMERMQQAGQDDRSYFLFFEYIRRQVEYLQHDIPIQKHAAQYLFRELQGLGLFTDEQLLEELARDPSVHPARAARQLLETIYAKHFYTDDERQESLDALGRGQVRLSGPAMADEAVLVQSSDSGTKGGIDFNPVNYDLRTVGQVDYIPFDLSPEEVRGLNIDGFVPVIINISPLINIPYLLGTTGPAPVDKISRRSALD